MRKVVKIYLDTSVFNRPFDDQTQPRIWLETLAFSVILQMIEEKRVILVSSSVLAYENSRNPFDVRRQWVEDCSSLAHTVETVNTSVLHRAQVLEQQGVKAADALHVACAEIAGCAYFLTCDDHLIRKYHEPDLQVLNPVDFVLRVVGRIQ
ncbi:MAG: PIN domain-containing protein [Anaerolineae bacterium]|nr:PIN domain-containing protein [Anaerolineae bacterium]